MSAMPHNLPAQATSFVGREDDVRAAAEALERARVVTLTGVGGVGKTRLAQEVGAEVLPRYPDGVWLCELAPIGEPDAIVHTIARELHVSQQQDLSARDSLMAFLRQQRTLLILDNCEHLLEPVADLVEDVVRNCPSLTVLATSREGIGVEGEHIRPVRSLSTPADDDCESIEDAESVRLFLERARAVRPDFELSPHNAQAVTEICRRLDGIALAIELAAARLTSMGPLEIAARLDRRFRFLRSGRRTAVERHRTLQAAADWSYALLGPDEQRLFERVSVFAGGFRLDAAERVCGDEMDADLAELIEGLVAKSLLNADTSGDDTRYFMLETLRQYAADKLAERGDAEAVRDAHLSWVRDLVAAVEREAFGSGDIDWIRVAEREIDNLLAGYEWAITTDNADAALEMIVGLRWSAAFGRTRELNDSWALRALGLPGADTHPLAPVVYGLVSGAAWYRGAREASREYAERALSLAPDPDDARRAEAMFSISIVSVLEGKADEGLAAIDEALRLTRLGDDPALEDNVALVRAMFISYTGDLERAQAYLDEAKPLKTSATPMRALERYVTGEVLLDADPPMAIAALEEAVELSRLMGHEFLLNVARLSEVSLRGRHFDVHEALAAYPEMIESWRRAGNWTQQWTTLRNLLEHFARIERDEAAVVLYFAAASAPTAGPLVWAQGERLGNLISELEARKGAEAFLAARKRGTNMTGEQAVAFALAEIDAALARREEPTAVP
jgi:predicted ATPase